jgi:hypothetical protein
MANWPDGTPRRSPSDTGSVGGRLPNGQATRHTPDTEVPAQHLGWLEHTPAAVSNPQGTPYFAIGKGTPAWDRASPPFTTGMQAKGRKPRR